ncbi:DNA primase [Flexithrix dorotheae]|uniref:DNA primase n=1 Tax=Flexithrix dorotheae TaxID=70993 RepID=UPI0003707871|nr:DNA primase [Flexithrix dorotheae]
MYISEVTIQKVRELPIGDIVSGKVQLKKNMGLSPFNDEKTPSFSVHPEKNIFHCFSSGKAGDGITFVMETEKLSFQEAIIKLANDHHIEIVYENLSPEQEENMKKEQKEKEALKVFLKFAADQFFVNDIPETWIKSRSLNPEILNKFQVGYTCETNSFFSVAQKAQYSSEIIQKAGLAKEGKNGFFDTYKNRIIFPIHDYRGNAVAFTARIIKDLSEEEKEARKAAGKYIPPKYINSPESIWYKSDHLYGIHKAQNAITKNAKVYLVEGPTDVLRFHQNGVENVVAPCGTALTVNQIKLIKRYTDTVCIVPDSDIAGIQALHRSAELLLTNGLHVSVLLPEKDKDPDEQLKIKTKEQAQSWLHEEQDYISEFLLKTKMEKASVSPKEKSQAIKEMGRVVELLEDETTREIYYEQLVEEWKDFGKYKLEKREKKKEEFQIPKGSKDDFFEFDFFEENSCYYTKERGKKRLVSSFTMQYLYFVETDNDPLYVVKFKNIFGNIHIKALNTDKTTVLGDFKKAIGKLHGSFVFKGNMGHLDSINFKLRRSVNKAIEPSKMGYNPNLKFDVWANGILRNSQFSQPDQYGVVRLLDPIDTIGEFEKIRPETIIELDGKGVFIENSENAFKQIGKEKIEQFIQEKKVNTLRYFYLPPADKTKEPSEEEKYKDEAKFYFQPNKKVDFKRWSRLLLEVYGENTYVMLGYYLMSINHHTIFTQNGNYVPILNLWGTPNNGKSTAARSLLRAFGSNHGDEDGMNVISCSLSGMMEFVDKFRNGMVWFNEFSRELKNDRIKLEMLKGCADGTNRKTRRGGNYQHGSEKNQNGTIISGQDSPSFDPGLHDRVITLKFNGTTKGDEFRLEELIDLQNKGLITQVTADLIAYRTLIEEQYRPTYRTLAQQLSEDLDEEIKKGTIPNIKESRVIKNAISVLAPMKILMDAGLEFPYKFEEAYKNVFKNTLQKISTKAVSDEVSQFFEVIMEAQDIEPGIHYKIQKEKDGVTKLFLRIRAIMPLYRQACIRQQKSPFNESDLKEMLLSHRACKNDENTQEAYKLGFRKKNVEFQGVNSRRTSAIVLNYEILRDLEIEMRWGEYLEDLHEHDDPETQQLVKVPPHLNGKAEDMIYNFLMNCLIPNRGYEIKQLWVIYNMDKKPPIPEDRFRDCVTKYCQEANAMEGNFTYRISGNKIYLEEKQTSI